MNNSNLKNLLNEYDKKRMQAIIDSEHRKEILYKENPRLSEIDDILTKEAIKTSKLLISNNDSSLLKDLNNKINKLKEEKIKILNSLGIDENYLKPIFECSICNDTGYINQNFSYVMCNCLKQKIFDIEYNKSNIFNLKNQNFDNFSLSFYSDKIDEEKYNSKLSPKQNIELIKKISMSFIDNFDNPNEKNLLFTGNTGLGKTFLSSCIANELLKKGKTVLYQTAPVMLDTIIDYRFGKENVSKDMYENILNADLLIIDDLGTESINNMKFSELFNIINTRLLNSNNKVIKTIISTNLSLENLFNNYDERIVSRFIGNYNICYFFGDDIRFKNKKI